MTTASRLGLWLVVAATVGAAAAASTGKSRRADAPVTPPAVQAAVPAPAAAPAPVVAAVPAAPKKHVRARVAAPAVEAPVVETPVASVPAEPVGSAGMKAYIDPETGLLGMLPADAAIQSLEDDSNFDASDLTVVRLSDGSLMVDLQGKFAMSSTVTLGPNGKRVFNCGQKAHAAHDGCTNPTQPVEE